MFIHLINGLFCFRATADDSLGTISLPVDDLFKGEEKLQWYTLHNTKHGEIQVRLFPTDLAIVAHAHAHMHTQPLRCGADGTDGDCRLVNGVVVAGRFDCP